MSDRLHDTLSSLRTDVDHMPLADSSAVRARGTQRTRRQAIGTSLAVVALVAGAVGISGALTGDNNKASNLPATRTTTTTTEARGPITTSVLLQPNMVPGPANQKFNDGETLESATAAEAEQRGVMVCGTNLDPAASATPVTSLLRTFPSDLDAFAWEWVAQYDSESVAKTVFNDLTALCTDKTGVQVQTIGTVTPPTTIRASQFSADPGSEFNGSLAGIAIRGDTVVVLGLRAMMRESDISLNDFDAAVGSAADLVASR